MEKKNTWLIVVVVILGGLVLGLGGFIIYEKVIDKDKIENILENDAGQEKNEKIDVNIPTFDSNDVYNLVSEYVNLGDDEYPSYNNYSLKHYFGDHINGFKDLSLDSIKLLIAIKNTSGTLINDCATVANDDIVFDGEWYYLDNYFVCFDELSAIYSYNEVNSKYKELFGSTFNAPKISIGNPNYIYYNNEQYITLYEHDDGVHPDGLVSKITDFNQNNTKLTVIVSYLYDSRYEGLDEHPSESVINNIFANRKDYSLQYQLEFEFEKDHYVLKNINKLI